MSCNKQLLSCKGAVAWVYGSWSFPVGKPLRPVKIVTENIRLYQLLSNSLIPCSKSPLSTAPFNDSFEHMYNQFLGWKIAWGRLSYFVVCVWWDVAVDLVHLPINVGERKPVRIQWVSFPVFHVFTSSASLMNSIAWEFQTIKWNYTQAHSLEPKGYNQLPSNNQPVSFCLLEI